MSEPVLRIRDLTAGYAHEHGIHLAVEGVDLTLHAGEILGLVGESACGKSTLALAATRWLAPPGVVCAGEVWLGPDNLLTMDTAELRRQWWRRIAWVPQASMSSLNPVATLGAHFVDTARAHGESDVLPRVHELLELVDLPRHALDRYPHELSGGMKQRAALALALTLDPDILIMDEPTTALDVVLEHQILSRLLALRDQRHPAILFITHDLPLLLTFADRVAVMYAGRIVEDAPIDAMRQGGMHPYTRGLLAAAPTLAAAERPRSIRGSAPSLVRRPSGCRFHPRCSLAVPGCAEHAPSLATHRPNHSWACTEVAP